LEENQVDKREILRMSKELLPQSLQLLYDGMEERIRISWQPFRAKVANQLL
jgi:hypothetical protein